MRRDTAVSRAFLKHRKKPHIVPVASPALAGLKPPFSTFVPGLFTECAARGVHMVQFLKNADMRCGNIATEIVDTGATSFQTRLPT